MTLAYATGSVLAQTAPAGGGGYSETQYARELLHLKQVDVMQAELAKAKGTGGGAGENLWLAQLDQAGYDAAVKDPANAGKATADYLAALAGYLQSQRDVTAVDGAWALDHAQFILSHISQPILTRMEYFSNNARDRAALVPLAAAADRLLKVASGSLEAAKARIETAKPFDEKAYNRAYAASTEARYYAAWALYFQAMGLDPAGGGAGDVTARNKLLHQAAEGLADWAIDTPDNGVNFQSYLLRGKAESEAGESAKALADFAKARSDKAPAWVQYQARYQSVVVHLRAGDFLNAQTALADFKKAIPAGNSEALLSADMLGYRVDWAVALTKQDTSERKRAQREALGVLAQIVARDGRFRDLVYEQLAAEIPENADLNDLFPMQQLALARVTSLNQKGDSAESRRQLGVALNAAAAVRINPLANNPDKVEAIFLQGVCNALLGNAGLAARFEVEFATAVPQDPRARQVIDLALQQIGQLRQAGAGSAPATQTGGMSTEELRTLAGQALNLSISTFGDKKWLFAQGRLLEEAGRIAEAAGVYQKIAADDRSYLDARYRLVALATERFGSVEGKGSAREQKAAAGELFGAAAGFMELLDHPPASAPPETLQAAQGYRYTIWLIEAATAVSPAVADTQVALDRLARLDGAQEKLTQAQRDLVLRYRMQAYQLAGQIDKAQAALAQYGKSSPAALENIRNLALTTEEQISRTHDAGQIKQMAGFVVMLLDPMIAGAKAEGKTDIAYAYRLEQADMMAQAGQFKESQALAVSLEAERKEDIRPYMIEARAMFSQAQAGNDTGLYAKAQDYFTRILARVPTGSEAFWESWLRVIQSMEAQAADSSGEIKARLGDLKAIYGVQFGGTRYHDEFAKLAGKYGVQGN